MAGKQSRSPTMWPRRAWRGGGGAVASRGSGGPLCLASLWELQEARFGWGYFLPSFLWTWPGQWAMGRVAGGPVGCTKALHLLFWTLALRSVLQTCFAGDSSLGCSELVGPAPSPGPYCRPVVFVAEAYRHCRNRPRGTDSPRARCQPRGSRWFCAFLKHLLSENISCRLTTQKRPLWTFWCIAPPPPMHTFVCFLNWSGNMKHTVLHLACFTW